MREPIIERHWIKDACPLYEEPVTYELCLGCGYCWLLNHTKKYTQCGLIKTEETIKNE